MENNNIEKLIDEYRLDEALEALNARLKSEKSVKNLLLGGKITMMQQKYGDSLNFFIKLEIEPNNIEAQSKISSIRGILNITNSFYFENTYLDSSLYE